MRSRLSTLGPAIIAAILLIASCAPPTAEPALPTDPVAGDVCTDKQIGGQMSYDEALRIAENSECTELGRLKDTHFCNENTGTWWIDMEVDKPGCMPACVVNVNDKSAEINWRCTGALPPSDEVAESAKPRLTSLPVDLSTRDKLTFGNTGFAIDLYQAIRGADGNLFYSPYSISLALAMTYAGARGSTAEQMAETLHFSLPPDQLHPAFNGLDLQLSQRGETAAGKDSQGFRLNVVNAIWGQQGYGFLEEFLDLLAQNYGAGLRLLDFVNATEESRVTINDWVSDQTEEKIKDLIPEGLIDAATRLVLTNAIYFNAAWMNPFPEGMTQHGPFTTLDGSELTVPMMAQTESFGYFQGDGYRALELPYDGQELSMLILLPDAGSFGAFEASLDASQLNETIQQIEGRQIALTMPKFEFEASLSLADTLAAMGMPDAFGGLADFSGMTGDRELFIGAVLHKAFVSVDEAGTEAAAATAVIMKRLGLPEAPIEVKVDRPFIFLIRDIDSDTILFVGRVLTPSAS